jgi:hypothetical protein
MKAENWFQLRVVGVTHKARSLDRAFLGKCSSPCARWRRIGLASAERRDLHTQLPVSAPILTVGARIASAGVEHLATEVVWMAKVSFHCHALQIQAPFEGAVLLNVEGEEAISFRDVAGLDRLAKRPAIHLPPLARSLPDQVAPAIFREIALARRLAGAG